jgi:hypothetical protein
MSLVTPHSGHEATGHFLGDHSSSADDYMHMATDMGSHNASASLTGDHGFADGGSADHGFGHDFGAPGTAEHGADQVQDAHVDAGAHQAPGGEYMAFAQPESGHEGMSHFDANGPPGMADTMAHAGVAPQEPPPADHLYVDAQMDHAFAQGAGTENHAGAFHADVPATPPPEPPPVEQHDAGHIGH